MAHVAQVSTLVKVNAVDSTTVTLNSVVAGSGLALLVTTYSGDLAASGVTSTGDTWSRDIQQACAVDGNGRASIFRAENVGAGTHTVTINPALTSASITAILCEITNTPTSATSDGTPVGGNANSSSPTSGNITIAQDSLLLGVVGHVGSGTVSITETYTFLAEDESTSDMPANMESRGDGGGLAAGAYALTWTLGSTQGWGAAAAGWKNQAAATGIPNKIVKVLQAVNRATNY